MKPVLYLHIGMNKTGSTALQAYMSKHYSEHLEQGVLYPKTGRKGTTHYDVSTAFGLGSQRHLRHAYDLNQMLDEMLRDSKNAGADRLVISSETFIVCKNPKILAEGLDRFDVRIVIYMRRHAEWIESLYNQAVKMVASPPWGKGFSKYLEFQKEHGQGRLYFHYWDLLERWADAFGRQNIIVRPFERSQFVNNDLIEDFLSVIGLDSTRYESKDLKSGESNISLSADRLPLIDILQRLKFLPAKSKRIIVRKIAQVPPRRVRKYIASPALREKLVMEYQGDYSKIAEAYLGREVLFYDPIVPDKENWLPPESTWYGSLKRLFMDWLHSRT